MLILVLSAVEKAKEPNITALWVEWGTQRLREHIPIENHADTRSMEVTAPPLGYRLVKYNGITIPVT